MEELLKALKENRELSDKLKKMWREKASAADILALLKEEGLDPDMAVVEEALEKAQKELVGKVSMEKLDDKALAAVSGGGDGLCSNTDDCDNQFLRCTYTFEEDRCLYDYKCDEYDS